MSSTPDPESPGISVAMATYNGGRFLREQLDSIARQTVLPLELVMTDDGSTDDTAEIAERFARTVSFPVRFIRNERRLGYADNFFHAASLCSGPVIAYCDQDDEWMEHRLEVCASFFADPEVMLACHTAAIWDGRQLTGERFPDFKQTLVHGAVTVDPFLLVPGFSIVFRAEILGYLDSRRRPRHPLNLDPNQAPEPMAHDNWTFLLASSIGRVVTVEDVLAKYRQHGSNTKGAPEKTDGKRGFQLALSNTEYGELASLEAQYAELISELSEKVPTQFKNNVLATSRNFRDRSRFHRLRSVLYSPGSTVFQRAGAFLKLAFSGAYRSDTTRTRLGSRAAVKDLLFGVPALSRLKGVEQAEPPV